MSRKLLGSSLWETQQCAPTRFTAAAVRQALCTRTSCARRSTRQPIHANAPLSWSGTLARRLRPYYDTMVKQDLQAIRRAEHERDPAYKPRLKGRIAKSFVDDALMPATRADLAVLRASSRAFHMFSDPVAWLKDPAILARILRIWAMPKSRKARAGFYPPTFGPGRTEMFARVGLANS